MPRAWSAANRKDGMTVGEMRDMLIGLPATAHLKAVVSIRGRVQEIRVIEDDTEKTGEED